MKCVFSILLSCVGASIGLFSDEENAVLPPLYHLDDFHRCLARQDGLYCMGEFQLLPVGASPVYENIKKYSNQQSAFNRSRLHRGYCVSERCPQTQSSQNQFFIESKANRETNRNMVERFESCVQQEIKSHGLHAQLRSLQYCSTHRQHQLKMSQGPDAGQQLFLRLVCAVLALNVAGTVYDLMTNDKQKIGVIVAWSLRSSWSRLTAVYNNGDPRLKQLKSLHGIKLYVVSATIYCHSWVQQYQFSVTNPQIFEKQYLNHVGIILGNGTSLIQWFVIISSFLTAFNMLIYSEKSRLTWTMLPVLLLKRIIRTAPVHLMVVGFAATYWPFMHTGPNTAIIEQYSNTCRRKFWSHVLFLNNITDKEDICLMPTWFIPVDMHLFVVSCALTIMMSRKRHLALPLYAALFVISSVVCGIVAFINGWQSTAFLLPENVRGLFRNAPSFSSFYTSTWGSLPSCFLGLFLAHLQYQLQENKCDWNQNKWMKHSLYPLIAVYLSLTYFVGVSVKQYPQRWYASMWVAIERPLFSCFFLGVLISIINCRGGILRDMTRWYSWMVPARLSLPMMLCHWIFSVVITARPMAYHVSSFQVMNDYIATVVYGLVAALFVGLLLEIPVQRFFAQLF